MQTKKMKPILAVLLIVVLVIGLGTFVGCGGKSADAGSAPAPAAEDQATDDQQAEDTAATSDDSDLAYITGKGALTIGITIFAPMNYYDDDSGKLIGFDTEFAEAVCEKLGVTPDFVEINWDTKEVELAAKKIDCIWNGLTVTEERKENMTFTDPYINNKQVIVIRTADKDKYTSVDSLAGARICAETGSAGEEAVLDDEVLSEALYIGFNKQTDTLMEVKALTSDAAVLDYTLANSMVGEGTSYDDLMIMPDTVLVDEEYAVGFRVGSNVVPEVNKAIAELLKDGTLEKIAEKYGLETSLIK